MTLRLITVSLIAAVLFVAGMVTGGSAVKAMMLESVQVAQSQAASPIKGLATIPVRNRWGRVVGKYTVVRIQTQDSEEVWVVKSE